MVPDTYKIAIAALDAVWAANQSDDLAVLLGGMAINANDQDSMDPTALRDWKTLETGLPGSAQVELILAYLQLGASRYGGGPNDISKLINALRTPNSPERSILDSIIQCQ